MYIIKMPDGGPRTERSRKGNNRMKSRMAQKFFQKRWFRITVAILTPVLLAGGAVFLAWSLYRHMFTANLRFTLQKVQVKSGGFWRGRKQLVCHILHLKPGATNLFEYKPDKMRKLLEKEPSIQEVQIVRELPDTLHVAIMERTPVALVNHRYSPWVVDKDAILMRRDRCIDIADSLPVIKDLPHMSGLPRGSVVKQFKPAVKLIMLTETRYPDIHFVTVSTGKKDQLECVVRYKNGDTRYEVVMPDRAPERHLRRLTTALEHLLQTRGPERKIDLRFRKQIIIAPVPGGRTP